MADKEKVKWYYEPWIIILLIILFLGPLGLPLVFKSPKFSRVWKWITTVLTLLYTAYLLFETVRLTQLIVKWIGPYLGAASV